MRITDSQSLFHVVFMALMIKLATTRPMARKLQARTRRSQAVCFRGELNGFVRDRPTWGDRIWLTIKPSIALATRHWKAIIKTQWTSMQIQPPSSKASSSSQFTTTNKKIAIKSSRQHHHSSHGQDQDNVNGTSASSWASFLLASQTNVAGITYWIPVPAKDPVIVTFFSSY